MADTDFWQDDVAGFPVWQLAIAVVGSIIAVIMFKHFTGSSGVSSSAPTAASGSAPTSSGGSGGSGGYTSPTTPNSSGITPVEAWLAQAQTVANQLGISASASNTALQNYLSGGTIYTGSGERSILNAIFSAIGNAPGVSSPVYYVPEAASAPTGTSSTSSTTSGSSPGSTGSTTGTGGSGTTSPEPVRVSPSETVPHSSTTPVSDPVAAAIKSAVSAINSFSSTAYARNAPEPASAAASAQSQATASNAQAAGYSASQAETLASRAYDFGQLSQSQQTYANLLSSGTSAAQASQITQNAAAFSAESQGQQTYSNLIGAGYTPAQAQQISGWNQG